MIKTNLFRSIFIALVVASNASAQSRNANSAPAKVSHAEPLFYDLVRDLGARKGEKELNVGADFANVKDYSKNGLLAEYEFAPLNRLGIEVETDFAFFRETANSTEAPKNKLENLRLSAQYSFFVSPKYKATLAAGYTQIIDFTDFRNYGKTNLITGVVYNPFLIAAKRWGDNFHTLIYTSSLIKNDFAAIRTVVDWQVNTSFHYVLPHSRHFIGIELNKEINHGKFEMTARPQMKIKLNENLAVGLVTGFPVNKPDEGFSSFFRVIYEY